MLLAIDVGNTNIVLGCIEGREIVHVFRMVTDSAKTEDEYVVAIHDILQFYGVDPHAFDGAIISTVVPPLAAVIKGAVKNLTGKNALIVGAGIKTGMNILLDNPAQMGSDLVCGAVAAIANYPMPAIVIDMGTATTIAVIDKNASYLGGAIFPGLALSMSALASRTSQLPKIPIEPPQKVISSNTVDCMKSGAIFGTASMLDGMIDRICEELGEEATVVATGGLAGKIVPHCKHNIIFDDNLLLTGLAVLYEKNTKKKSKTE